MDLRYWVVDSDSGRVGVELALSMSQMAEDVYEATVRNEDLEASLDPPLYSFPSTLEHYVQAYDWMGNRSDSPVRTVLVEECYY